MKRVLVTGATGFVGRPLVSALAQAGHAVRAAVRAADAAPFPAGTHVAANVDLTRPVDWRPLLEGVDAVVHLAGIAHTGAAIPDSVYDRVNRAATAGLAEAAARAGIRHLIFVSSVRAQTGAAAPHIVTEDDAPAPSDAYGRSKLAAEATVAASGVPFTILRPALIFGPGVKGNLRALLRLAALPMPLPFGAFDNRRSLVSLADFIGAVRLTLENPPTRAACLVAHPQALSLAEIVAALRRGRGRRPGLLSVPPVLFRRALEAAGKHDLWERLGGELVVDPSRLVAAGWKPSVPMPESLAEFAAQATAPRKADTT